LTNNINITILALDCKERNNYFKRLFGYGSEAAFNANCVNISEGDRP
jgi:hypothetical protein